MIRDDIIAEARTWIGTPHVHQARIRGVGVDCIGLVVGVASALGFASAAAFLASPYGSYSSHPNVAALDAACAAFLVRTHTRQPGDILLMQFIGEPQHFGILTAMDYVIHAYAPARAVVEHRIDQRWRRRIVRAYCYREIA